MKEWEQNKNNQITNQNPIISTNYIKCKWLKHTKIKTHRLSKYI